jgi:hypothetical protein
MTKSSIIKEFDNEFMCRGQFYVQRDILGHNQQRTIGFGYATLDGRRQFLAISLEMNEALKNVTIIDKLTLDLYALLIYYISDNGDTWCRGLLVPCFTSGQELIFAMVNEHLPNRERADRMFSHGIRQKAKGFKLTKTEDEFLLLLGKAVVDSGQDFETRGVDLSDLLKKLDAGINRMDTGFAASAEQLSKAKSDILQDVANSKKDVVKALTGWNSPKTKTTQKTRAKFYDVSVQTIKRWEKPPFKGRPDYYDREASMEDQKKHGEQYMRDHRLNKYARENRKRKRMD